MKKEPTLFYRQKVLLSLLEVFGEGLSSIDFQKYLFLFVEICQKEKSYDFVPYKYGCFSFQSYADRRRLIDIGALQFSDNWQLSDGESFLRSIKPDDRRKIELFHGKFSRIKGNDLIREVYRRYPYYAIKSEIASELMTADELSKIDAAKPRDEERCFFTIGYEGNSFEHYLNRLIRNNIGMLVDVRKNPLSRKYGFSQKTLSETLRKLDIEYLHMPELGIVSEKRQSLKSQHDYEQLFDEYENTVLQENIAAIKRLYKVFMQRKRVAITCFEAEVCMCHRGRIVKALQALPEWTHEVKHI